MNDTFFRILASVGLLVFLFLIVWFAEAKTRKRRKARDGQSKQAFENSYKDFNSVPGLKIGRSYNFPTFTVSFETKAAYFSASDSGANDKFVGAIQSIYQDSGTHGNAFDAKRAVTFMYPGRIDEIRRGIYTPQR